MDDSPKGKHQELAEAKYRAIRGASHKHENKRGVPWDLQAQSSGTARACLEEGDDASRFGSPVALSGHVAQHLGVSPIGCELFSGPL